MRPTTENYCNLKRSKRKIRSQERNRTSCDDYRLVIFDKIRAHIRGHPISELSSHIAAGGRSATLVEIQYDRVSIPGRYGTRHLEYTAYLRLGGEAVYFS